MEKISFQASYTRISLYAQVSAASAAKKAQNGAPVPDDGAASADGGAGGHCQRNKDGDTFTLSVEAQSIRISGTMIVDDSGNMPEGLDAHDAQKSLQAYGKKDKAALASALAKAGGGDDLDRLSGAGFVNAFLDAMDKASKGRGHHGHHPHFPRLSDPQDVADTLMGHLDQQHAEQGGSRADFADKIKQRLAGWNPSASSASSSRVTVEYSEFRSEVHMKMTAGLDAWAAAGPGSDAGNPAVSADPGPAQTV
jgi:hypothetical protein